MHLKLMPKPLISRFLSLMTPKVFGLHQQMKFTFILLLALILGCGLLRAAAEPPPNLIFILADDLGYGELGSYGQKIIQTPNLDRMANEGIRFTQFYAGAPVCAPSRSVLLTGLHGGHTRIRGNSETAPSIGRDLQPEDKTVADVLKEAGYHTAMIGKWGLGDTGKHEAGLPRRHGFDEFFGYLNQRHAHNQYTDFLWRNETRQPLKNVVTPVGDVGAGYATKAVEFADDLFADEALAFVSANAKHPFFLYWSIIIPHSNNERKKILGDGAEVPDYGPYANKDWPNPDKGHAAMITRMDGYIGRLMDKLHELGIAERTVVIFASDNGPHNSSGQDITRFQPAGGFSGLKGSLLEGGIRVPALAWWPGTIKPSVSPTVGGLVDWLPTAAELAGAPIPENLDGRSLVPTLRGQSQKPPHFQYWEFNGNKFQQAALLDGRWKGIRSGGPDKAPAVYDLLHDPSEKIDVAADHPDVTKTLADYLTTARSPSSVWQPKWEKASTPVDDQ